VPCRFLQISPLSVEAQMRAPSRLPFDPKPLRLGPSTLTECFLPLPVSCYRPHSDVPVSNRTANMQLIRIRLAWLPPPFGMVASGWFALLYTLSGVKFWCSALCLAFARIPVRAANASSAAQMVRLKSKGTGADSAHSAPQTRATDRSDRWGNFRGL
jgi:hypothetical protein